MATVGIEYPVFAKISKENEGAAPTYNAGHVIGALMQADISLTRASEKMYADNIIVEAANDITGGTVTVQVDDLSEEAQTEMLGVSGSSSEGFKEYSESSPYVGFGYLRNVVHRGVPATYAVWYPKMQFGRGNESYTTKQENTTFSGETTEGEIMPIKVDETGKPLVREYQKFDTVALAKAWLNGKAGIAA